MPKIKNSEMHIVDQALGMQSGYVLDFSDRTMSEFFEDEFGIDIYDHRYSFNGTSKAKRLRAFIETEDSSLVGRVLRRLWHHKDSLSTSPSSLESSKIKEQFFELIDKIEAGGPTSAIDVIESFAKDPTLEELVSSIDREIKSGKPQIALDRLHTYCVKKFSHLLDARGKTFDKSSPLHGRAGIYIKEISAELNLSDMSTQIAKSVIGVLEKFNFVRNNQTLAHDNTLISPSEARFIYDGVVAFLRFVKAIEKSRFE